MPEMDGYELLRNVRTAHPNITRIVLSGYAEEKLIFKVINTNLAKTFLSKPWKENDLLTAIKEIISVNEKLNNEQIKTILNSSNILTTIPELFYEINKLIEDENSDMDDIIRVISTDPVIAARILKTVNSSFFGVKTGSLKTAILNMGLLNIKTIIATTEIFSINEGYYEDLIWKHSSLTNILTIKLYEYLYKKRIPEIYSTVGLLHDIGKVAFFKLDGTKYKGVLKLKETHSDISLEVSEKNSFGFTHTEIGSILLSFWDMPSSIIEVALYHHTPELCSEQFKGIINIVNIAGFYSWQILNKNFSSELQEEIYEYFNVKKSDVDSFIQNINIEVS
jgi:HD-like signal output (HDOD) protein